MIQFHQNQNMNLSPFLVYTMTVPNIDYHYSLNTIDTELLYMTFLPSSLPAMYNVYELESIHISPHSTFSKWQHLPGQFFSPPIEDHAPVTCAHLLN